MRFAKTALHLGLLLLATGLAGCATAFAPSGPKAVTRSVAGEQSEAAVSATVQREYGVALSAMKRGRNKDAEGLLLSMTRRHPDLSGPFANLGIVYRRLGKLPEAAEFLGKAIDINPDADYFADQKLPFEKGKEPHRQHPPGKAGTCTLCVHRIEAGQAPICVSGCPSRAMIFGDRDDPNSLIHKKHGKSVPLLAAEGTHPKVGYICSDNLLKEIEARIRKNPKMAR